jgi:hypothetical protein
MSLINKIENLQKKPEAIRRRVLAVSVAAIMFIIVVVWIFTLNLSKKNSEQEQISSEFTPFGVFRSIIKDAYSISVGSVRDAFGQLKNQFDNDNKSEQ